MTPRDAYNRCNDRMLAALADQAAPAHPRTLDTLVGLGCLTEGSRTPTPTGRDVLALHAKGEPRDPRGTCEMCGRKRRIRNDGSIGAHQTSDGGWCPGGGGMPDDNRGPRRIGLTVQVHVRVSRSLVGRIKEAADSAGVLPRDVVAEAVVRWLVFRGHDEASARGAWRVRARIKLGSRVEDAGGMTRAAWSLSADGVEMLDRDRMRDGVSRSAAIGRALAEALT